MRDDLLNFDRLLDLLKASDPQSIIDQHMHRIDDPEIYLVLSTLWMSSDTLKDDPTQLDNHIIGRLGGYVTHYPAIRQLVTQAFQHTKSEPALKLVSSSLRSAGGLPIATYHLLNNDSHMVALESSDDYIVYVSLLTGGILKVVNWKTGAVMYDHDDLFASYLAADISGDLVVTSSLGKDGVILKVLNWRTNYIQYDLKLREDHLITAISFTETNEIIFKQNRRIMVLDWQNQREPFVVGEHPVFEEDQKRVLFQHFYVYGSFVVSDCGDVRVWNWRTQELQWKKFIDTDYLCEVALNHELVFVGKGHWISVYDWQTDEELYTMYAFGAWTSAICVSGNYLVASEFHGGIRIWNWQSKEVARSLSENSYNEDTIYDTNRLNITVQGSFAISADTQHAPKTNSLSVWKWSTGKYPVTNHKHQDRIQSLVLLENHVITGSHDHTIKIWNVETQNCIRTLVGHTKTVSCFKVIDEYLISRSWDSTIKVWNWQTGTLLRTLLGDNWTVNTLTSHGNLLVSPTQDKTIKIWDWQSGELLQTLMSGNSRLSIHFATSEHIVGTLPDGTIQVWHWTTGKLVHELENRSGKKLRQFDDYAFSFAKTGIHFWNWKLGKYFGALKGYDLSDKPYLWKEFLITISDSKVRVLNLKTKEEHLLSESEVNVIYNNVSISDSGTLLLHRGQTIQVYSVPKAIQFWSGNLGTYLGRIHIAPNNSYLIGIDNTSQRRDIHFIQPNKALKQRLTNIT